MKIPQIILVILLVSITPAAGSSDLDSLATEILEEIWSFHPIAATNLGVHKYDTNMPDYSNEVLKWKLNRFKRFQSELGALDTLVLSVEERVDYHLLRASLHDEIFDIETVNIYENNPLLYSQSCIASIHAIMIRYAESIQRKMAAVTVRLNQMPGFLETARQNLKKPSYILCNAAINQLTEGERFIEDIFEYYKDSLNQESRYQFRQAKTKAVASMMVFAYWLEKNQVQDAMFALGEDNYNYKLHNIHLADITADSILKIGTYYLAWTATAIDSLSGMLEPSRQEMVTLPSDFGPQSVVQYRERELNDLRGFVAVSELVTLPEWIGEIEIVETPAFLLGLIPGVAMMPPGPFDRSRKSYFYTPPLPRRFELEDAEYFYNYIYNHWFRGPAVHEAYPGHHLQLSIANNHPSSVRRGFRTFFFVEGWALYCEEMMATSGLYEDTIGALINALEGVRYRAARIIVDVKLQTGVFSYEDALRFMVDTFGGSEAYYAREVTRYISNPIQPSSYLVGKLQIQDLLEEYRELRGDNFDLKKFHDELLSHGSIPLKLVRLLMLRCDE